MVQKGDYQKTLSRPGDCAVESNNLLKCLGKKWWRRRESNPRPKILPSSFYMLSSSLRCRPAEFPGTGFLQRYPAKKFASVLAGASQKLPCWVDALCWFRREKPAGRL